MVEEYTTGALTAAISTKKMKKKKLTNVKKPLEDLFTTSPVAVKFEPCQKPTPESKVVIKSESEIKTEPAEPQKECEGQPLNNKLKRKRQNIKVEDDSSEDEAVNAPQKRSRKKKQQQQMPRNPEEEARTIFVGNLPKSIKTKDLIALFKPYGTVETARIRSVAVADPAMPRKLAVIRRDFHPERNNMNAYVRFETVEEAESALALNGHNLKKFLLRVDMANGSDKHDHHLSLFLGNLPFNIDENSIRAFFQDCGDIVAVRVVRDPHTGMGKGIGFISFEKAESIELALELNECLLGGRSLRVTRCTNKTSSKAKKNSEQQKLGRKNAKSPAGTDKKTRAVLPGRKKTGKQVLKIKRRIANRKKDKEVTNRKVNNRK